VPCIDATLLGDFFVEALALVRTRSWLAQTPPVPADVKLCATEERLGPRALRSSTERRARLQVIQAAALPLHMRSHAVDSFCRFTAHPRRSHLGGNGNFGGLACTVVRPLARFGKLADTLDVEAVPRTR
jgi:hypothetical protein